MKTILSIIFIVLLLSFKTTSAQIPNNDFETWVSSPWSDEQLQDWTSLYSELLPSMIVKDADAYSGNFSMHMYNGVFDSYAYTSFSLQEKPVSLRGYVKGSVEAGDSIYIRVVLYEQSLPVDSGRWVGYNGFDAFTQVSVSISQNSPNADSALVYVSGGTHENTEIKVDLMTLDFESAVPPEPAFSFLSASPNPFIDQVTLHLFLTSEFNGEISIIDVLGRKMISIPAALVSKGENEIPLNTSSLPSGNYWCVFSSEKEVGRIRMVKAN